MFTQKPKDKMFLGFQCYKTTYFNKNSNNNSKSENLSILYKRHQACHLQD